MTNQPTAVQSDSCTQWYNNRDLIEACLKSTSIVIVPSSSTAQVSNNSQLLPKNIEGKYFFDVTVTYFYNCKTSN